MKPVGGNQIKDAYNDHSEVVDNRQRCSLKNKPLAVVKIEHLKSIVGDNEHHLQTVAGDNEQQSRSVIDDEQHSRAVADNEQQVVAGDNVQPLKVVDVEKEPIVCLDYDVIVVKTDPVEVGSTGQFQKKGRTSDTISTALSLARLSEKAVIIPEQEVDGSQLSSFNLSPPDDSEDQERIGVNILNSTLNPLLPFKPSQVTDQIIHQQLRYLM